MKSVLPWRSFAPVFVACVGMWAEELPAQNEGVSVSYSLEPSPTVTLREPIVVHFEVVNESTQPIMLRMGLDRIDGFSFRLERPDGSVDTRPPTPRREGLFRLGDITLAAGERLRHQFLLNEWASLTTPGEYELDVRLLAPIEMSSGAKVASQPYHTSFKLLPRDDSQLKAACERLVQQIESSNFNVSDMRDAASALAHVNDPIAVPYLERALRSGKYIDNEITEGLARVGTEDAAQVLIAVIKELPAWPPNADTTQGTRAIHAWQALGTIERTTSNERLKQEIRRSVPR